MSWNWRSQKHYIVEHFLPCSVLWQAAQEQGVSHRVLAGLLGRTTSTVQFTLAGKNNLTWDRAMQMAAHLGMKAEEFGRRRDALEARLARELDPLYVYPEFPSTPPVRGERLVMAYHIQDRLLGRGWDDIFGPDAVTSDMVWRARIHKGWSRARAGREFGVVDGTVYHWETANFPATRWAQALDIYGVHLA